MAAAMVAAMVAGSSIQSLVALAGSVIGLATLLVMDLVAQQQVFSTEQAAGWVT